MNLIINGETRRLAATTLAELLSELDYDARWLATAVNGAVVHRDDRDTYMVADGDRIEILSPMQGG